MTEHVNYYKMSLRGFTDAQGDMYHEVTGIQGYTTKYKIGDIILYKTKQELEDDDKRFIEVFTQVQEMLDNEKLKKAQIGFDNKIKYWENRCAAAMQLAVKEGFVKIAQPELFDSYWE